MLYLHDVESYPLSLLLTLFYTLFGKISFF